MFTIDFPSVSVKTDETPAPVVIAIGADDFDAITDDAWEAMASNSAATDAVCSGHWVF